MRWFLPLCFLFLTACKSTIPSENISQQVINDLNAHQQAIEQLDKQVTKECKNEAFVASLNSLKSQTESIKGQVKSIQLACSTEKRVLEQKIVTKDIIITVLIGILVMLLFFWIRFRK